MFLLYINDITNRVSSTLRLFADDCLLYRKIKSPQDSILLQKDLDLLSQWASIWQMNFNTSKCVVLRCSRSPSPIQYIYRLNAHILDIKEEHPYLGITLHQSLSWSSHISKLSTKASQTFNFLRRNLSKCSPSIKASAYLTLVRPILEYAAVAWDPHQLNHIHALEKIQRRAARWVMNNYSRYSSVSEMLHNLNWQPLQLRRRISRLQMFYKAVHNLTALSIPQRFLPTSCPTRNYHQHHYIIPSARTNLYQHSFYPRTIKEWNLLPISIIETNSLQSFSSHLTNYVV